MSIEKNKGGRPRKPVGEKFLPQKFNLHPLLKEAVMREAELRNWTQSRVVSEALCYRYKVNPNILNYNRIADEQHERKKVLTAAERSKYTA